MQTVLITGCSSGFGLETARRFLDRGWAVVATMRRPQQDVLPPSDRLRVLALDVTDPAAVERAVQMAGPVDVLVNNAGIGWLNALESTPMTAAGALFETNTLGTIAMTQAVLPQMRQRRAGVIVNVSSSVTLRPLPLLSVYTASKAAVNAFTESLALELEPFGIRARLVLPGRAPETSFGENARARMGADFPDAYADFARGVFARMGQAPSDVTLAGDVAEAVWRAATDPSCPMRLPAGADAVAAAGDADLACVSRAPSSTSTISKEQLSMTHKQHPLGTPFPPAATADEILAGVDLTGKNAIVTGGHAGIGLEVSRALAKAGASVTLGARDPERAAAALGGIARVDVGRLDLVAPLSIDAFAAHWLQGGRPLHILVNGAGASGGPERDARGYETQFATNHLGHFQLTLALLPALRAASGARVVNISSGAQRFGRIRWDDPNFTTDYDSRAAYAQSKTANVLFAVELDRRWAADGIRGYAVHPGVVVGTKLNSSAGDEALKRMGLIDAAGRPIIDPVVGKKTPQQGASTVVFAAAHPLLDGIGGVYLKDNDISPLDDGPRQLTADCIPAEVVSHSIDPAGAERLWVLSERLLDV